MNAIPTAAWPFFFAVLAVLAARLLVGRVRDDAPSLPGWILYAVAIACVIIGFALMWLDRAS